MDPHHHYDKEPEAVVPVDPAELPNEPTEVEVAPAPPVSSETGGKTEIGPTIVIRGKLRSGEDLVVRGRIEADITSSKSLHVESSGIIKATVRASSVRIEGIVVGNITATERLEIAAGGRVVGDLYAPRIAIREGAAFRGNIDMPGFDGPGAPAEVVEVAEATEATDAIEVAEQNDRPDNNGKRKKRKH